MGDFNIDINKDDAIGHDKLDVFCDTLNLISLNLTHVTLITINQQLTYF